MPTNKPEYQVPYYKKWYHDNKEIQKYNCSERRRRIVKENRQKIVAYLNSHPCVDCGETDIVVLEFDHVCGKKHREVSTMIQTGCSWPKILQEIGKCEIRCANDHARKTAQRIMNYRWAAGVRGNIAPF